MTKERAPHVVVCGAGLTGLATAWHLRRMGADVTVIEQSDSVGGVVRTTERDGYLVEHGPNSCTLTPELSAMVAALDLTPLLRNAAPQAQRRYIVRRGKVLAAPSSPLAALRTPLLSFGAKLRVLGEAFVAQRNSDTDESVADFVRRRLGQEPLTWGVDPFVSGVYAGDPEMLSVKHAFPRLAALEREHGSLLRGIIAQGRAARRAAVQTGAPQARHTMVSFADGMSTLPLALADDIGTANVLRRTRVTGISGNGSETSVVVECDGARRVIRGDAAVCTVPLPALREIDLGLSSIDAQSQLATVRYPPVVSIALGFRRADVKHALDGFGCLVPSAEHRKLLGVLFSSTLFDGRAPENTVLLTCFLGGVRHPQLAALNTQALLDVLRPELASLLGVTGAPRFVEHTVWPRAIPQYNVGHDVVMRAAPELELRVPGLLVDGQFLRGVSVGDCIAAGRSIAARALAEAQRRSGLQGGASMTAPSSVTQLGNAAVA